MRALGLRLAALALLFNLLGPLLLAGTPAAPAGGLAALADADGVVVVCTGHGLQVIPTDPDGQPAPVKRAADWCPFCLPLLKQGGAAPVLAGPVLPVPETSPVAPPPPAAAIPFRIQARLTSAPRAPPIT